MFDSHVLQQIKQTNVSKDTEKTKDRVKEIWMNQKSFRGAVLAMSGLTKYTVHRTYREGNISARLALAMAQVLKINPNFLTGASDERGDFSDNILRQFLIDHEYGHLISLEKKDKRPYNRKSVDIALPDEAAVIEPVAASETVKTPPSAVNPSVPYALAVLRVQESAENLSQAAKDKLDSMTPETAEELLKLLLMRSEYSDGAKRLAELVKFILTL